MYDNVGVVKGADRRLLGETGVKSGGSRRRSSKTLDAGFPKPKLEKGTKRNVLDGASFHG
jgi:hypothetical protein